MLQMELELTNESEEMLTCGQVAKLLGVSKGTINRWVKEGHFPNAWRINPHLQSGWRIPESDVDAFIALRRTQRGYFYVPIKPPESKAE